MQHVEEFLISKQFAQNLINGFVINGSFRDLSYNNLSGPIPKFPARTFKYALFLSLFLCVVIVLLSLMVSSVLLLY